MPKIKVTEVIERPVEEVWSYLDDPRNELEWQSSARQREVLTEGPLGKGSRYRAVEQFIGRKIEFVWEVTEHEPTSRVSYRTVSGPFDAETQMTLEPAEGGTRLTVEAQGAAGLGGIFGKLADPVITRIFRRETQADLGKLKDLLEARG